MNENITLKQIINFCQIDIIFWDSALTEKRNIIKFYTDIKQDELITWSYRLSDEHCPKHCFDYQADESEHYPTCEVQQARYHRIQNAPMMQCCIFWHHLNKIRISKYSVGTYLQIMYFTLEFATWMVLLDFHWTIDLPSWMEFEKTCWFLDCWDWAENFEIIFVFTYISY